MSPIAAASPLEDRLRGAEERIEEAGMEIRAIRAFLTARATPEYQARLSKAATDDAGGLDAGGLDADELLQQLRARR